MRYWPILLITFALCACAITIPERQLTIKPEWSYKDLKSYDPIDAIDPADDIIAIYTRKVDTQIQIRLDLLDLMKNIDHDIYIFLNQNPGGNNQFPFVQESFTTEIDWDLSIIGYSNRQIIIIDHNLEPVYGYHVQILRDPELDMITISLDDSLLDLRSSPYEVIISIVDSKTQRVVDKSPIISSIAQPPSSLPIMLAFWNTYRGETPTLALRSWDSAHSGPGRSRHGLTYLLKAIKNYHIPIFLLDLNIPENLSALDYSGKLGQIRELTQAGLLVLPDVGFRMTGNPLPYLPPSYIFNELLNSSRRITKTFNLPNSNLLAMTRSLQGIDLRNYEYVIEYGGMRDSGCFVWKKARLQNVVVLGGRAYYSTECVIEENGLTVDYKRWLINTTLQYDGQSIIILGGSFVDSYWGYPEASENAIRYINTHPWLTPVNGFDLLSQHSNVSYEYGPSPTIENYYPGLSNEANENQLTSQQININFLTKLSQVPEGQLKDLISQAYYTYLSPASNPLYKLRAEYLGLLGHLLSAAEWYEKPSNKSTCSLDVDWDGKNECILSSQDIFFSIDLDNGYIPYLFYLDGKDIHQVIAPSHQFVVGLSDPSTWNLNLDLTSDPNIILGGFIEKPPDEQIYAPVIYSRKIELFTPYLATHKSFEILDEGVRVSIRTDSDKVIIIPTCLDPWKRFNPGWSVNYTNNIDMNQQDASEIIISIPEDNSVQYYSFTDSKGSLRLPEDPNYEYPPGYYLPFPMSVLEIDFPRYTEIRINLNRR